MGGKHKLRVEYWLGGTPLDGRFALLFLALSGNESYLDDCALFCFERRQVEPYLSLSYGQVLRLNDVRGYEGYVRYEFPVAYSGLQPVVGASWTSTDDYWIGAGFLHEGWRYDFGDFDGYMQTHLMPGYYHLGEGLDLGHKLEFRSGVEFGVEARSGLRFALSYDHKSNADIGERNPGVETFSFRVSLPLGGH